MKKVYYFLFLPLCIIALVIPGCMLDKEPEALTGKNNENSPVFLSAELAAISHDSIRAKARLSFRGNLDILHHGWVWSENPDPTMDDNKLDLGNLPVDSFVTDITGLELGIPYYFRPYVRTGSDTFYGPEECSFLGVNFAINTNAEVFRGADVAFTNSSVGSTEFAWDFGDQGISSSTSPIHTFNTIGIFTVRLTAKIAGCVQIKDTTITVIENPFEGYWVEVPGGTFMMGCTPEQGISCEDDERPAHVVTLDTFFIGRTEVTQAQWEAVLENTPSFFYDCGPDCPVETVSWDRIVNEFIPALKRKTGRIHRLPTEAEWEFAARGGNSSKGYKYAGGDDINTVGWYSSNSGSTPYPVGTKAANELGLYDMSGNVWEWCNDWYDSGYYVSSPPTNPAGPTTGSDRVLRGGSWANDDYDDYFRVAHRSKVYPNARAYSVGFRVARH